MQLLQLRSLLQRWCWICIWEFTLWETNIAGFYEDVFLIEHGVYFSHDVGFDSTCPTKTPNVSLLQAGGPPMNHKKHVASIVDGMVTYMHKNFPPGGATFVGTVFDLSPQSAGARRVFPTDFSFKRFRNTLQKTQLPTLKASCELEVCFRKVCFWCFF